MAAVASSQKVLEIVKRKGPVIPTEISRELGTESWLASAILSELVSGGQLRISSLKMGGTPLYYAAGQEEKLQDYTKYLHEQERRALELLKAEKVLQDRALDPVTRVALRGIKDFAFPLNVQKDGSVELFWKWYLLSNEEAEPLIKKVLGVDEEKREDSAEQKIEKPEVQQTLPKTAARARKAPDNREFAGRVLEYFSKGNVEVVEKLEAIKKGEAEFIISVPSSVGTIKYYCMAKDKKSCNEGDLSTAYVKGQGRKLPVLFLTTGKLTKSASEMLEKEFSYMNVKTI